MGSADPMAAWALWLWLEWAALGARDAPLGGGIALNAPAPFAVQV